ncbi:MAG: PhoH family protein [Clostridia bacterium]|nr:PhoH family protein [Clostridia bacterium]
MLKNIFGANDENVAIIEDAFDVSITVGDGNFRIEAKNERDADNAFSVVKNVISHADTGEIVTRQLAAYYCDMVSTGRGNTSSAGLVDSICLSSKGTPIKPKTRGQKELVDKIFSNTITFGIGPAGTGKTFLAVAAAVSQLRKNQVKRIILTRPAVEAGESLGFLPGDLQDKIDPYLRPLYDSLFEIMGEDSFQKKFEKGVLEIAPLAYMRGRTLNDAFIILDEAQNATREQLKMFLTRIGTGSKMVINGDVTQIDLPGGKRSGLLKARDILDGIDDIAFVYLTEQDVVRHDLVKKIIKAYEKDEERNNR